MGPFDAFIQNNLNRDDFWNIENYLAKIPIQTLEDFEVVAEALKSLIEPKKSHNVPGNLKGRIAPIKEILDSLEVCAIPYQSNAGKHLILQQVAGKIHSLSTLTKEEREKYLADQKLLREKTALVKIPNRLHPFNDDAPNVSIMLFSEARALRQELLLCYQGLINLSLGRTPPSNVITEIGARTQALENRISQIGVEDGELDRALNFLRSSIFLQPES